MYRKGSRGPDPDRDTLAPGGREGDCAGDRTLAWLLPAQGYGTALQEQPPGQVTRHVSMSGDCGAPSQQQQGQRAGASPQLVHVPSLTPTSGAWTHPPAWGFRPGEIYLSRIELHPDHQGRGIGGGLISALIDEAVQKGQDLVLDVLTVNHRAQALYQRLGLKEVAGHAPTGGSVREARPWLGLPRCRAGCGG